MSNVEHFKCDVRRFDNLDSEINSISNQIKPLNDKLKELKKTKTELQINICSFMETNEIGECKLQNGTLKFKETKNIAPLSKSIIKDNIFNFFKEYSNKEEFTKANNEEKANILFSYVYDNRDYLTKNVLKRVN